MDSLLANYASSDDEEENQRQNAVSCSKSNSSSSLFSSLPHPKSSLVSSSLTQFKHQSSTSIIYHNNNNVKADEDDLKPSSKSSSSLFSSLPQPKTQARQQPVSNISSIDPPSKRVVQFKPPINPNYVKPSDLDDEDDEDEGEKEKKQHKKYEILSQSSSVKSFLSSIPAPRNSSTFGVLPSAAGSGRRSIVETEAPVSSSGGSFGTQNDQNNDPGHSGISASYVMGSDEIGGNYATIGSFESGINQNISQNANGDDGSSYGSYESYGGYGNYDDYAHHSNSWSNGQATAGPERTGPNESALRVPGKRGRKDIPTEVIEVKQDELTKNRPREDQVKLTGIAFGPSYQPAASTTKGKPSKLHKRKHQIGSLYYDMKQKEMEMSEQRAKGLLTKAQTQAKYGW